MRNPDFLLKNVDFIIKQAPALKKEYRKLKKKKLLLADEDCIQRDQGGKWHVRTFAARILNGETPLADCLCVCSGTRLLRSGSG